MANARATSTKPQAKEIGKELGVRYVLEGSVQRDQNRVRVNAQLIDAASGAHLWADRFEEDVADLFKLQDQVVARLANALGYELVQAEAEAGAHSKNPDAIDLDMRGWAAVNQWMQQPPTKDTLVAVRASFDRALEIDPNDTEALRHLLLSVCRRFIGQVFLLRGDPIGQEFGVVPHAPDEARTSASLPGES